MHCCSTHVSKSFLATLELTWVIVQSFRYFCSALTKFVIPRQIFINVPNIKFHENPPSRRHNGTCGETDGRDEDNTRFSRYPKRLKCNMPNVRFSTGVSKSSLMFLVQIFFGHILCHKEVDTLSTFCYRGVNFVDQNNYSD